MAHRSGEVAVVRSVGSSPSTADEDGQKNALTAANGDDAAVADNDEDGDLPQCKIKRNYSCNLCPFFSQNPRSFLYHSRDVHFDRIKIYECSQCLYASKHSQKLQRHVNMIHVNGKNRAKRVGRGSGSAKPQADKKREQRVKPSGKDAGQTACPVTPAAAAAVSVVVDSAASPDESRGNDVSSIAFEDCGNEDEDDRYADEEELLDKELKCSVCSFASRSPSLMRRHERVVHLKKRFLRCSKCSYVTHVKARYTKHVKYHSMPMIKCDLCDFRTPYKWNLDRHYKNHCGSGAFQCSKCNFRADIKQSLTVHEMNHHIPPVGQGAVMARRKNKVGASETTALESDNIDKEELELLRMEREDAEPVEGEGTEQKDGEDVQKSETDKRIPGKRNLQHLRNSKMTYRRESVNNNLQTDFIHPDDIVPRYGQIYVKTLKCKFCSYKAVFSHELWRHEKRIHDYVRPESKKDKLPVRPPPKLIPLQNKVSPTPPSSPILKIPAVRSKVASASSAADPATTSPVETSTPVSPPCDKSVNEKEFTEMCKKSCLTSSLKDFVSLIGDEEGLKTIPDSQGDIDLESNSWTGPCDENEAGTRSNNDDSTAADDASKTKQTDFLKKKNASFFDKLKEKLLTGTSETCNLICDFCGHESKCLSEAVAHQKRHSTTGGTRSDSDGDIVLTGAELSSTRCQHCRQRCKTSTDLINHLKSCKAFVTAYDQSKAEEGLDVPVKCEEIAFDEDDVKVEEDNSMENRVFVWNDLPQMHEEDEEMEEMEMADAEMTCNEDGSEGDSQMYGTVTSKGADNTESGTLVAEIDPRLSLTVKKVFKCPHCSFWASTASRFHVHIVGHLNKKPFECSLCLYRSNWRWDITKHIRLKSARDPSHLEAKVNMTDETGRRNYSKYNKYLTMMKVQEPSAESSGTGRRSKACDATQGTAADGDIIPLPAPPRLTRAPTPGTAYQLPQGTPLRPPPPLKAAHHVPPPPPPPTTKKTLWKCKKCNFRDSNKDFVLCHVKEHYGKKNSPLEPSSPGREDGSDDGRGDPAGSALFHKTPPFRCGHCHQVSNWKHVIQRHCRLKHNGYVLIELDWKDDTNSKQPIDPAMSLDAPGSVDESLDTISCDICPFTTDTEGDLTAHKLNHVDRPGSIFKCTYCPFYVPSKIAVLEHMEVHGIECGVQLATLKFDNFEPSDCNEDFLKNKKNEAEPAKRYKCRQCPYVSNSKTQFLYHKQFHKPRGAPFKCMYCSYNVSRRHLLHQHLRVHDATNAAAAAVVAPRIGAVTQNSEPQSGTNSPVDPVPAPNIHTADLPEIPQVWVYKSGNFQKMFKCRWCPHVNVRKMNIQEHEKMHRTETKDKAPTPAQSSIKLQCPDCNYVCNNAGVLTSHMKVHQGVFGEIRSLVDPSRPDSEQIQNMQTALRIVEPEVVIRVESESEDVTSPSRKIVDEEMSSHPESVYIQSSNKLCDLNEDNRKILSFCNKCPARFFLKRELRIHSKFHLIRSPFGCPYCSYTARQRPHLLSHYKVHSVEYQQRTKELVASYTVSTENPRRKTVEIAKTSDVIDGAVWMLEASPGEKAKTELNKSRAKYACNLCPAKFFKSVALQYHLSLHGGSHKHKCKYCDYAVKTYGNLMRHQLVHEECDKKLPITKTDTNESETLLRAKSKAAATADSPNRRRTDPQFGTLMHGSPEFIYPTYLKNGKIKEKRYKCHKCPSAFEKREQYRVHLSLHGAKQKYKCEKCDYSVKYYANYVQHMRKHQNHDEALEAMKSEGKAFDDGRDAVCPLDGKSDDVSDADRKLNPYELTLVEQQTLLLQERKRMNNNKDEEKKLFWCAYCPYVSNRRDCVDNHARRHFCVSGIKSTFECMHCDYTATQANFLREHNKLHFTRSARHKVEAYLKCEQMELWYVDDNEEQDDDDENRGSSPDLRTLIFRDRGESCEDRFFPPIPDVDLYGDDEEDWKMYVNPETGEPVSEAEMVEPDGSEADEDLIEMVEEHVTEEEPHEENNIAEEEEDDVGAMAKPKMKRLRGKKWKCKKCPHAFGKRDQYLRHVGLHGSNQRHSCDICDYSVKFYTNYIQHMRMHQMHEPDRVIHVKNNAESLEESAMKMAKEAAAVEDEEEVEKIDHGNGVADSETACDATAAAAVSGDGTDDMDLFMSHVEEVGGGDDEYDEEMEDSVMSQAEEKLAVEECCEDEECSSLTGASEASVSSEDATRLSVQDDIRESSNFVEMDAEVCEFVNVEINEGQDVTSVIS